MSGPIVFRVLCDRWDRMVAGLAEDLAAELGEQAPAAIGISAEDFAAELDRAAKLFAHVPRLDHESGLRLLQAMVDEPVDRLVIEVRLDAWPLMHARMLFEFMMARRVLIQFVAPPGVVSTLINDIYFCRSTTTRTAG